MAISSIRLGAIKPKRPEDDAAPQSYGLWDDSPVDAPPAQTAPPPTAAPASYGLWDDSPAPTTPTPPAAPPAVQSEKDYLIQKYGGGGNLMDGKGSRSFGSAAGGPGEAVLGFLNAPNELVTRAGEVGIMKAVDAIKGQEQKPFVENWRQTREGGGFAGPIGRVADEVSKATTGEPVTSTLGKVAIGGLGLAGDFVLDPANLIPGFAGTKLTKAGKVLDAVHALNQSGKLAEAGYEIGKAGELMKSIKSDLGTTTRAATAHEVLKELNSTEGLTRKGRKTVQSLLKDAAEVDKTGFTYRNPDLLSGYGKSEYGLQTLGGVGGKTAEKYIGRHVQKWLNAGRLTVPETAFARDQLIKHLGGVAELKREGQSQLTRLFKETPELETEIVRLAKTGDEQGMNTLMADIQRNMETARTKLAGVSDTKLEPGAPELASLVESVPYEPTLAGKTAEKLNGIMADLYTKEKAAGKSAKLRFGLSESGKAAVEEAIKRGDWRNMDEAMADINASQDKYANAHEWMAARGPEELPAWKPQADALPFTNPPDMRVLDEATIKGYAPRMISTVTSDRLRTVLPLLRRDGGKEERLMNMINDLQGGRPIRGTEPSAIQQHTKQRSVNSQTQTFEDFNNDFADMLDLSNGEEDALRAAIGGIENPKAKKILDKIRQDGFLETNPFVAASRRIEASARSRAAIGLADTLKKSVDKPGMESFLSRNPDAEWFTPPGFVGGNKRALTEAGNKAAVSLKEIVPGLPKGYEDIYVHPHAAEWLQNAYKLNNEPDWVRKLATPMNEIRRLMVALPKTAIRNVADSWYKNLVVHGKDVIAPAILSGRVLAKMAQPQLDNMMTNRKERGVNRLLSFTRTIDNTIGKLAKDIDGNKTIIYKNGEKGSINTLAQEALDHGIFQLSGTLEGLTSKATPSGLANAMEKSKEATGIAKVGGAIKRTGKAISQLPDYTMTASNLGESHARLASFIADRMKGKSPTEAARNAFDVHWTASLPDSTSARLSQGDTKYYKAAEGLARHGMAFYFFQKHNVPFWWRQMFKTPSRATAPIKLEGAYDYMTGQDSIDPEYASDQTNASPFPRSVSIVNGRPKMKVGDISSASSQISAMGPVDIENLVNAIHPGGKAAVQIGQLAAGLMGGNDLKDIPVSNMRTQPEPLDPGLPTLQGIAQNVFPPAGWVKNPLVNAFPDKAQELGFPNYRPTTVKDSLVRTFLNPINTRTVDIESEIMKSDKAKLIRKRMETIKEAKNPTPSMLNELNTLQQQLDADKERIIRDQLLRTTFR